MSATLEAFFAKNEARGCAFAAPLKARMARVETILVQRQLFHLSPLQAGPAPMLMCQKPEVKPQTCLFVWIIGKDVLELQVTAEHARLVVNKLPLALATEFEQEEVIVDFLTSYKRAPH